MSDVLLIKTSSLGDVIHQMPAVTEARLRLPGARLTWVVEEAFAPLATLHPGVDAVIAVASRRWRHALHEPATWREVGGFMRTLRARTYDTVVDTQGLFRTALIARLSHGVRHGYDADSVRESWAAKFYDVRHGVDRSLHAIARNRMLTGLALGYSPEGAVDFGLDRARLAPAAATRTAVLLHGTARARKGMAGVTLERACRGTRRARIRCRASLGHGTRARARRSHRRGEPCARAGAATAR